MAYWIAVGKDRFRLYLEPNQVIAIGSKANQFKIMQLTRGTECTIDDNILHPGAGVNED